MSYKFLAKNGPTIAFGLFVVCCIISVIPIIGGVSEFYSVAPEKQATSPEGEIFLPGLYIAYGLLIVAVVFAILLALWQIATNPKASVKGLIALGIIAVGYVIFYATADPVGTGSVARTVESFGIGAGLSKFIGGGISLTIIMLLGSVVVTILMEIWNYFKNQ